MNKVGTQEQQQLEEEEGWVGGSQPASQRAWRCTTASTAAPGGGGEWGRRENTFRRSLSHSSDHARGEEVHIVDFLTTAIFTH